MRYRGRRRHLRRLGIAGSDGPEHDLQLSKRRRDTSRRCGEGTIRPFTQKVS
jgi:hypothetical protein